MLKSILTEPTIEPVSLGEAKDHLIVEHNEDDPVIYSMISAARRHVEARCNRVLVRQKWRIYLDNQLQDFKLEPFEVQEVEQIQYVDIDGATQTVSSSVYTVDIPRQCVYEAYAQTWPDARWQENAAWADVWAGEYKTSDSPVDITAHIPEDLKSVIKLMVTDLYENRGKSSETQLFNNDTYDALLAPHVVYV